MENTNNQIGWTIFFGEAGEMFGKSFQKEISEQLETRFNQMMGTENFVKKYKFSLLIGVTKMKLTVKDNYSFILVDIITSTNFSKTISAYWTTKNNIDLRKSDCINSDEIEFGWCSDFDKEYFKTFIKESITKKINDKKLKFKLVLDYSLYPDLNITYNFKNEPTENELKYINEQLKNIFKTSYVSEITKTENEFNLMIDFEGTLPNTGIKQLENFILDLNNCKFSTNIEKLKIQ